MSPRGRVRIDGSTSRQRWCGPSAWVAMTRASSAGSVSATALPAAGDAAVVDQQVDVAEVGQHRVDHAGVLLRVVDARLVGGGRAPGGGDRLDGGPRRLLVAAVVDRHDCSFGRQQLRDASPDPPAAAGHQRHPSIQLSHAATMTASGCLCQPTAVHEGSKRAIIAALLANFGIAILKFIGWIVTQSASLLAECVHSMADTGNQALLLFGGHRAAPQGDADAPLRLRARAVLLELHRGPGAVPARWRLRHLRGHREAPPPARAGVAVVGGRHPASGRSSSRPSRSAPPCTRANQVKGQSSYFDFIRRSKSPELPVVLLEDSGALIGLFLALFGVVMSKITDNGRWDALGSLSIGVLLCVIAIFLAIEMKGLLIGESAAPEMEQQIVDVAHRRRERHPAHPHQDAAPGAGRAAGGGQGRVRP